MVVVSPVVIVGLVTLADWVGSSDITVTTSRCSFIATPSAPRAKAPHATMMEADRFVV